MEKQAPEREKFETLRKENKTLLTLNGDVQYNVNISTNITIQHQTLRGDVNGSTSACRKEMTCTTRIGDFMARNNVIGIF